MDFTSLDYNLDVSVFVKMFYVFKITRTRSENSKLCVCFKYFLSNFYVTTILMWEIDTKKMLDPC